jgi:hypothetical protein
MHHVVEPTPQPTEDRQIASLLPTFAIEDERPKQRDDENTMK